MESNEEQAEENIPPIYGLEINDGINAPFADLYWDMFPEFYEVE